MSYHGGTPTIAESPVANYGRGDTRALETLSTLADEAERSAELIAAFIGRFAGHGGNGAAMVAPVPSGHSGQIDRLREALASIDKLARELGTIG